MSKGGEYGRECEFIVEVSRFEDEPTVINMAIRGDETEIFNLRMPLGQAAILHAILGVSLAQQRCDAEFDTAGIVYRPKEG